MKMIEQLKTWAEKVSKNKKRLDKSMFDELMESVLLRIEKDGYDKTFAWLKKNYIGGKGGRMLGVILLRNNSKLVKDKLWSLKQHEYKN